MFYKYAQRTHSTSSGASSKIKKHREKYDGFTLHNFQDESKIWRHTNTNENIVLNKEKKHRQKKIQ